MPRFPVGGSGRGSRSGGNRAGSSGRFSPVSRSRHQIVNNPSKRNPFVNGFYVEWPTSQPNPQYTDLLQPTVTFVATATGGGTIPQVQVQWAHWLSAFVYWDANPSGPAGVGSNTMGPTYTINNVTSGANTNTTSPSNLDTNVWYVRVRAGDGTNWSRWSAALQVSIYAQQLAGAFYVDENVGQVFLGPQSFAAAYIDENVGWAVQQVFNNAFFTDMNIGVNSPYPMLNAGAYIDENVGPAPAQNAAASAYLDMNIDSSQHPVPQIWWVVPVADETGWLFHIFGHGFGDSVGTWSGEVLMTANNGQTIPAGVITWERINAALQQNELQLSIHPGTSIGSQLKYLLATAPSTLSLAAGDLITWDEYWDSPSGTNLGFGVSFTVGGNELGSFTDTTTLDTVGSPIQSGLDKPPAYKTWLTRQYAITSGQAGTGVLTNVFINHVTQYGGQTEAKVRIRNIGVLDANTKIAKWWALPPNVTNVSFTGATVAQNGATLDSAVVFVPNIEIAQGNGLDTQTILPEHGHIVVSVPPGAQTGPIKVRLQT